MFYSHPREAINYHYQRNPSDPRIQHTLTLEVNSFGNVLKEATIGYGRRNPDTSLPLDIDRDKQTRTLITYTDNQVTNPIETDEDHRTPLPAKTRTYELTGLQPENDSPRFSFVEWTRDSFALPSSATEILYEEKANHTSTQKRLLEQVQTRYRPDDLGTAQNNPLALLPLGIIRSQAIPGESYKLAFTPGLLDHVYVGRVRENGLRNWKGCPHDQLYTSILEILQFCTFL